MWEWFFDNAILFIIISLVLLAVLLLYSRRPPKRTEQPPADNGKEKPEKGRYFALTVMVMTTIGVIVTALILLNNVIVRQNSDSSFYTGSVRSWLNDHGIPVLAILLTGYLVYRIERSIIPQIIERSVKARYTGDEGELVKRSQTLSHIIVSTFGVLIFTIAILMLLAEMGRDITPLLAGAGIAGVAIGFGAQSLVKDILNGLFIILEDQYRKGDVVKIAETSGLVEDLSLRRTVLRDLNGTVHTIPNGQIVTASNLSKEWSRINFDVPVPYNADIDRVLLIIDRIGVELAEDPRYKSMITSVPRTMWVSDLNDRGVLIKVSGETKPLKQWDVASEMRKRILKTFTRENIGIPWAYRGFFTEKQSDVDRQICKICGFSNPPNVNYCSNCGTPIIKGRDPN